MCIREGGVMCGRGREEGRGVRRSNYIRERRMMCWERERRAGC